MDRLLLLLVSALFHTLHCNAILTGLPEDGLLAAFLTTLATAAPSLQALRLDAAAGRGLINSTMISIVSMANLRQLALIDLQRVTHTHLKSTLAHLPNLQDLAVMYVDERDARTFAEREEPSFYEYKATDMVQLLYEISWSCTALRTLALGHLPYFDTQLPDTPPTQMELDGEPLPAMMSRLTALSSLALHHIGWEYAPGGLPSMPQLRRLSLVGDYSEESALQPRFRHQISTLTGLQALQVTLPDWPGRLPAGLTQLAISPLGVDLDDAIDIPAIRDAGCVDFLRKHLPPLRALRHLAIHSMEEVGRHYLPDVCTAAAALPHLVSLHVVNCDVIYLPAELCQLSRLQLLSLCDNRVLLHPSCTELASVPLHELKHCRILDLRCSERTQWDGAELRFRRSAPLSSDVIFSLASMPALERLGLPPADKHDPALAFPEELAALAQRRPQGLPSIRVVADMPESDCWSAVHVELPFEEVNDMLGVQLDRSIVRGVPPAW